MTLVTSPKTPIGTIGRLLGSAAAIEGTRLTVRDPSALASSRMDDLAKLAVFGEPAERD